MLEWSCFPTFFFFFLSVSCDFWFDTVPRSVQYLRIHSLLKSGVHTLLSTNRCLPLVCALFGGINLEVKGEMLPLPCDRLPMDQMESKLEMSHRNLDTVFC